MGAWHEVVLFDLEFTAWSGSRARGWSDPDEYREVVQIGALRLDAHTGAELGAFSCLVKPVLNPVLSPFFTALTGITEDRLAGEGLSFEPAYEAFLRFLGLRPLVCYGWDHEVIAENIALYGLGDRLKAVPAGNLHRWFAARGIDPASVSSADLANAVGVPQAASGRRHDALEDCRSIAAAVRHVMARGMPSPFLVAQPVGRPQGMASLRARA